MQLIITFIALTALCVYCASLSDLGQFVFLVCLIAFRSNPSSPGGWMFPVSGFPLADSSPLYSFSNSLLVFAWLSRIHVAQGSQRGHASTGLGRNTRRVLCCVSMHPTQFFIFPNIHNALTFPHDRLFIPFLSFKWHILNFFAIILTLPAIDASNMHLDESSAWT
jgi:hypothetical protein